VRISELSTHSQVSIPTIKYYLREGLLPPGTVTAPNQATYDESHLARLRLIRALIEVGRLTVAHARHVLEAVDSPGLPPHALLGTTHHAISRTAARDTDDPAWRAARKQVEDLLRRRGWQVELTSPGIDQAADAIRAIRRLDQHDLLDLIDTYAAAAETVAAKELDMIVARREPVRMVEGVVTGTILGEALLTALRLLAEEDASQRRLGTARPAHPQDCGPCRPPNDASIS
jgi:DNA-binding transcriptional MerR regulator